jgi:hypothetical protein
LLQFFTESLIPLASTFPPVGVCECSVVALVVVKKRLWRVAMGSCRSVVGRYVDNIGKHLLFYLQAGCECCGVSECADRVTM